MSEAMRKLSASRLVRSIGDFLYPPMCLCCKTVLSRPCKTLCQACVESLQLLSPAHRCRRCFHPLDDNGHRCVHSSLTSHAICFEEAPACQALLSSATAIAPFLIMQWAAVRWPIPDLVIPTPGDWFSHGIDRWAMRKELARTVGALLNRPSLPCLRIRRHLLPVPHLPLERQPSQPCHETVKINLPKAIVNMDILLIHDQTFTGHALHAAADALVRHGAAHVRGMSFIGS